MPEVTDLMRVAQWAKSSKDAPSIVYNAACRLLDQPEEIERLRAERDEAVIKADAQFNTRLEEVAERDALKAAVEEVRGDAERQRRETGTTYDSWKLGIYAQACRTLRILNRTLEASGKATESHGDGRTPQTLGTGEGHEATEAQEAAQ